MFRAVCFAALLAAASWASQARAQGLNLVEVPAGEVRIDGSLRDWEGVSFTTLGAATVGQLRYVLGFTPNGVYVAARVFDERFVRSARPSSNEDAVVLSFAAQLRGRWVLNEVWLFAGDMASIAASASIGAPGQPPRTLPGVEIVEGPLGRSAQGYVLEAFIPFSVLPGGANWREGRAAIRLHDVDSESHPAANDDAASARVDAAHPESLPALFSTNIPGGASASDALASFLAQSHLASTRPSADVRADVAGSPHEDRVLLIGNVLIVVPANAPSGSPTYAFATLPFDAAAEFRRSSFVDVTGDGKQDFSFEIRERTPTGLHTTNYFATFARGTVDVIARIDSDREIAGCSISNRIAPSRGRNAARLSVQAVPARCARPESWVWPENGVETFLLPWGRVTGQVYEWREREFVVVSETTNPHPYSGAPRAAPQVQVAPAPSPAPSAGDVLAQYRVDQHVAANIGSRFDQNANVAETATPEHVCVLDRSVVVFGRHFRSGTSYLFFNIPVAAEADILSMTVDDVTGDGVAEILVRVRQPIGDVTREVLLVHRVAAANAPRLAAIEVARARGSDRVESEVRVVGDRQARHLEIGPGRAQGWTRTNYPFTADASPGMDALVLPWASAAVRYALSGDRLVAVR